MRRAPRLAEGFSLLELILAIVLSTVVLLTASSLIINFGRFTSNVVRSEASLMGTALGAFEELIKRVNAANHVTFPAVVAPLPANSSMVLSVDTLIPAAGAVPAHFTPANFADDTTFTYWLALAVPATATEPAYYNLMRTGGPGDGAGRILAEGILSLSFTPVGADLNRVRIVLEARAASGPQGEMTQEHLETTAVMRSRSGE